MRTRAATENEPVARPNVKSPRRGRLGRGRPDGIAPTSPTRGMDPEPQTKTAMLGSTSAISADTDPSRVRPRTTSRSSAARPATVVGRSTRPGWTMTSHVLASANCPVACAPRRSGICPKMIFAPIPDRNPTMTECGTKRVYRPSRATPAAIIRIPAMRVSRNSARDRSASGTAATAEPVASADALVVVMTMSRVLEERPPATGPIRRGRTSPAPAPVERSRRRSGAGVPRPAVVTGSRKVVKRPFAGGALDEGADAGPV